MKTLLKRLLGIYQILLSFAALFWAIFAVNMLLARNSEVHWPALCVFALLVGSAILFCPLAGIRLLFPSQKIVPKLRSLTIFTSVLTILLTIAMSVLLAETWNKGGSSAFYSQPLPDLKTSPPNFVASDLNGNDIDLSSLRGKFVLLDFWATWCGPCLVELPHVQEARNTFSEESLAILGISLDEDKEKVDLFCKQNGYSFPQILDYPRKIAPLYGVETIPSCFLIDKEGVIVARNLRGDQLMTVLSSFVPKRSE